MQKAHPVAAILTPNFDMMRRGMTDADVKQRLDAVMAAIGLPSATRVPASGDAVVASAETQQIATAQIDELLRRVSALTSVLGSGNAREWDDGDRLATQLLLADLRVVTSTTRALNRLAAARLTSALDELVAARRDAEHSIREFS